MRNLLFISAFVALSLANPVIQDMPVLKDSELAAMAYSIDFSQLATTQQFSCVKQSGYSAVFIRGYSPLGQGGLDSNACANIQNAYTAGIGTEVYMTPQPASSKAGYQQLDEMITGLQSKGITIRGVWIQVTSPVNWGTAASANINFITSILTRARQYNYQVGIYTNVYDWNQITGGWTGTGSDVMLWYWNVQGSGPNGESPANFNDFRSFGCWTYPTVKQFAQVESVCSITCNRDVYAAGSKASGMAAREFEGPTVGGHFVHM